ncbi:MAG: hypothetical protein FD156_549 [Nitrospirae bacterium]|nr:MAG: hypothetical protein FD156_549 [Nitrospirota bacterium]
MLLRRFIIALAFVSTIATSSMSANLKDIYRPSDQIISDQTYPQIIQKHDYATIKAIEALYSEINKIGKGVIRCETDKKSIILRQTGDSPHEVVIGVLDNGPITIRNHSYGSRNTVVLFTTLRRVLADLSSKQKCAGIQADKYSTRAYKKITILAFDFGQNIVELNSLSNGPKDEERLYTLDIVSRKDSFFWGKL